jgi:hypothetical protein
MSHLRAPHFCRSRLSRLSRRLSFCAVVVRAWALAVAVFLALAPASARAAPPHAKPEEDAIADGDHDAYDLVGRATVGRAAVRSPPGGQAWLSLAGFTRSAAAGPSEIGGFVVVGLPLDRMGKLGTRAAMHEGTVPALSLASATTGAEGEAIGLTPRAARATVEIAWRAAGLGVDDARLDAIMARARWSAALPETRLRAIRYDDERLYGDTTTDPTRSRDSTGARVGLEARLTWRFDRLLYGEDEPSFERMRMERHDARARIAGRVLEALFHWQRAWLEVRWAQAASRDAREPPGRPSRDEVEAALRVMEAEATLDVLTAGWFTSTRSRALMTRPSAPAAPVLS